MIEEKDVMKIVFATGNKGKLREAAEILGDGFELVTPEDFGITEDIPETGNTLRANSLQKAEYLYSRCGCDCFADDTGLEVDALAGMPGVYSARYANIDDADYDDPDFDKSHDHDSEANMRKLLAKMDGETNRKAQFRTVVALVYKGQEYRFEGIVKGDISTEKHGTEGFGYDPVFVPEGYSESFAELGADVKNKISHRALAVEKLVTFLKEQK